MVAKIVLKMKPLKPIGLFLCVCAVSVFVLDYVRLHVEFHEYKKLHKDSVALVQQIKEIKSSISNVGSVLSTIQGFSSKLRKIASIPSQIRGSSRFAKKPNGETATDALDLPEKDAQDLQEKLNLEEMKLKVDDLHSEVIKQKETIEELSQFFDENPSLLASVPSIRPAQGYVTS